MHLDIDLMYLTIHNHLKWKLLGLKIRRFGSGLGRKMPTQNWNEFADPKLKPTEIHWVEIETKNSVQFRRVSVFWACGPQAYWNFKKNSNVGFLHWSKLKKKTIYLMGSRVVKKWSKKQKKKKSFAQFNLSSAQF